MQIIMTRWKILRVFLHKFGPYIVVVALPGGTLLALLLFVYRRSTLSGARWMPCEPLAMSISRPAERLQGRVK